MIRDGCDSTATVASALAVYAALTEISSDEGRQDFTTTVAHISAYSGLADRCVRARLHDLVEIGVLAVETPALKAPSYYRLVSVRQQKPHARQSVPDDRHLTPHVRHSTCSPSMPTVEEQVEEQVEEPNLAGPDGTGARAESFVVNRAQQPAKTSTKPVDDCFVALARAEGSDLQQLTSSGAKAIAVALASIRKACPGVTPEEIDRRALNYFRVMPAGTRLTAHALAKYWARLGASRPERVPAVDEEPLGWRDWVNENSPDCEFARGGAKEGAQWHELEPGYRRYLIEECRKRDERQHRRAAA